MNGKLYIVATPIGNLKDITFRAIEILTHADTILAEDTRTASTLLKHYQINNKKVISYFSQNEKKRIPYVVSLLEQGQNIALISEAGTPLISDPGHLLIKEMITHNIDIISIPGPTALTTLLPLSGFPLSNFYFGGFLSPKSGKRKNQLKKLLHIEGVLSFYESPHRIVKTLNDMFLVFGNKEVVIGRELTKKFEEIIRGKLENLIQNDKFVLKGEFTILLKNH